MTGDRTYGQEVERGERFEFGKNWRRFLSTLSDERISEAENSLKKMLGIEDLQGKSFLDVGSGSGLFSLAARRLGARVHSFDYDPQSVACTRELRQRYFSEDPDWTIEQGSVLDVDYLKSLGDFDVVYSWGVLHHTGAMWVAIGNVADIVRPHRCLYIAIYRKRRLSAQWLKIKRFYNRRSGAVRRVMVFGYAALFVCLILLKGQNPWRVIRNYKSKQRGMSWMRDIEDWLGGLPYEWAEPEEVTDFLKRRGFECVRQGGMEYLFIRSGTIPNKR